MAATAKKPKATTEDAPISLRTEASLVFPLLLAVNLITKPFFARHAKEHSLKLNEWRVMFLLAERPGLTASEICDLAGMLLMNVSRAVRRLERMGRVERTVDPHDQRRYLLRLTEDGREVFRRLAPSALQREAQLRDSLTEGEAETLIRLLDKVVAGMRAAPNGD
ncbi:MAG: winged helix-turn-helix transcriptional regulator [Hyphomicrobiales bacterium]|nr:winged helix-turn-helix transcriptional regulator [Hyphomicrobiales bacterium]